MSDTPFLGHPRGLAWLSFSEFWERFSYYGMQALLVLYMTHLLLLPGHVEHVLGFGPFRRMLQSLYGPLSPQALASAIFGLYTGLVYLTPIGGGILADRVIGRTRAVTLGASLMAIGHFLMAFETGFLVALLCLLLGVGCFKGNIATQVGELYGPNDPHRADGFQIYLFGIQLAVIVSPLICGTLGEIYGWHWGFAAAGVGMLIGLSVYTLGRPTFPQEISASRAGISNHRPPLRRAEWRNVVVLAALLPVLALALVGNQQIFNAYLVWGESHYQLVLFGLKIPVTWILSFGAIISAAMIGGSVLFWQWWSRRWIEPDEITKMAIGAGIGATAPLALAAAAATIVAHGHKVGLGWAVAFQILNDLGFANLFPVGLALYSRASPKGVTGVMIGLFYVHLLIGNLLVGWLGGLLERMTGTAFWLLHASLIFVAAAILLVVRGAVGRVLAPSYERADPVAATAAVG